MLESQMQKEKGKIKKKSNIIIIALKFIIFVIFSFYIKEGKK